VKPKYLLSALVAAVAVAVWRRVESDRAEQDLWAEATDPVR